MKLLLGIVAISAVAAVMTASAAEHEKKQTVVGYLVDIACVTQRSAELATLGPKHTRSCLSMSECERSGYGVLTLDRKVLKFSPVGNEKAKKLIASSKRERDYRIAVTGNVVAGTIEVNKLELVR